MALWPILFWGQLNQKMPFWFRVYQAKLARLNHIGQEFFFYIVRRQQTTSFCTWTSNPNLRRHGFFLKRFLLIFLRWYHVPARTFLGHHPTSYFFSVWRFPNLTNLWPEKFCLTFAPFSTSISDGGIPNLPKSGRALFDHSLPRPELFDQRAAWWGNATIKL